MKKLVVLSGAGVSAESGLQTFRDSDGLWEGYDISEVATPGAWRKNPSLVLEFYNQRRKKVMEAIPNAAHQSLAALQQFFDLTIITQNIDDLHERASSKKVLHLHGEILKKCSDTNRQIVAPVQGDMHPGDLAPDGGKWRPDIVWFEEPVPKISEAIELVRVADIFLVVGSSLVVYPAAGLLEYVPASVPKFIIDKKIPYTGTVQNLTCIEAKATEGMALLMEKLLSGNF